MLKGFGILTIAAGASLAAGAPQTFTGVVTDNMCGANHAMMHVTPESECVRECVRANPAKYKYSLYDGKHVYILSDQKTPEQFAAQKVTVRGTLDKKTNTISVDSIQAAK